jgi:hypothetical protein
MSRSVFIAVALVPVLLGSSQVRADLFIDLPDITVTPSTSNITLEIRATHDPGDSIQFYSLDFVVTRIDAESILRFKAEGQQDPAPSYTGRPEYVLNPVSLGLAFLVDHPSQDESLLNVSDETSDGLNHTLGFGQTLLAVLQLELLVEPDVNPLGTFAIEVLDTTFFVDELGDELLYTTSPGTLNVVPEPSTLGLALTGMLLIGFVWRRRNSGKRKAADA